MVDIDIVSFGHRGRERRSTRRRSERVVLGLNGGVDRRAGRVEEYALDGHLDIGRGFSDWTPGRWETARVRELDRRTEWNDLRVQAAVGHGGRAAVKPDCCGRRQRGCM